MTDRSTQLVSVIGGSGFIGRHVIRALARRGYRVRAAMRRPDLAGHLQPLGTPGQIMPVQANVRYPDSVHAACEGADIVINLVGILYNAGAQSFDALHTFGAEAVARAARETGARRLVHMSAIGAEAEGKSNYARTKAEGEAAVMREFPDAVIMRPSVVFGPEDDFFNRFASLARFAPALPLIGGGKTRLQPVFVGDVAEAFALAADGNLSTGTTYELGGPDIMTLRDVMEFVLETTGRNRLLVPVPFPVAKMMGAVFQLLPKPLLTMDQVELLRQDNVVSEDAATTGRTLDGIGIQPQGANAIVPSYLYRYRKAGQFSPTGA